MVAASRSPVVLGADGLPQQLQATDLFQLPVYLVANLPSAAQGAKNGSMAYASNGRTVTGSLIGGAVSVEAAGAGTGVLVTYSGASSAWQIAGTNTTVAA